MVSIHKINSGEVIGMGIVKISAIPHISILGDDHSTATLLDSISASARNMCSLLNEVYSVYKEWFSQGIDSADIALESIWTTRAIENQPFKAAIDIYLTARVICKDKSLVHKRLADIMGLLTTALSMDKYEFTEISDIEFISVLNRCNQGQVQAIVKEERIEDLQNQYFPTAFTFDTFPTDFSELARLVHTLIATPDCAVSFQLMPTYYRSEEIAELNRISQIVSMLTTGIQDRSVGTMSISAAGKIYALYKYYTDSKARPLFCFNILLYGNSSSLAGLATRVAGQLSVTNGNTPNFRITNLPQGSVQTNLESIFAQPWVTNDYIQSMCRSSGIWQTGSVAEVFGRLAHIITADEAACFFRLPIGSDSVNAGFQVNETEKNSKTYQSNLVNSGDISLGVLKSSSGTDTIGLSLKDIAKHMLIVGTPGSGKTTFSIGLLDRLWKNHHIPFIVIEPAKNEYRALIQSIPELQIFTPGKNHISPFVFNPFIPPKNVRLESYKSTLKTAFAAGVTMTSPLDKIFEDTINNCYSDFRWLDNYTSDNKGRVFNISDFIKCFKETFDEIGYTGDARNIGRAGTVRLKSLINLFDNYFSIPIEDILSKPTIIELAAIENSDQKALIIALLLLSILVYVNSNYVGEGGLKNFILLEEAHVLLDSESSGGEGAANPAAIAQGLVKRMLAEIRSYGVGLGIADQSPRKVGIDIVALTDIKVAFRLVEEQDKRILADATGLNETQTARLARLKPGEAYLFFNRLNEAEEIATPDYRLDNAISISLSDDTIRSLSTYWDLRKQDLRPYPECLLCPYCKETCNYERRMLAKEVARRIFKKRIGASCRQADKLKVVLRKISDFIKEELNDEPFNRELLSCVKVYLWRHIAYDTDLKVPKSVIENSLSKA